jgi:hypothetical protein
MIDTAKRIIVPAKETESKIQVKVPPLVRIAKTVATVIGINVKRKLIIIYTSKSLIS